MKDASDRTKTSLNLISAVFLYQHSHLGESSFVDEDSVCRRMSNNSRKMQSGIDYFPEALAYRKLPSPVGTVH